MKALIIISLFLLIPFSEILPQYTKADSSMARTTYTREFSHTVIDKYLNSDNLQKTKAALLSIAHSEDTLWVRQITKLNFSKYGKEICFALGELGPCSLSTGYLLERIKDDKTQRPMLHEGLAAIGKTGDLNSLNQITRYYNITGLNTMPGISLAIYSYYSRGIADKDIADRIILSEINRHKKASEENFEASFALIRTFVPDSLKIFLREEIKTLLLPGNVKKQYAADAVSYFLGCLRKLKYFPDDKILISRLLNSGNYSIKVETAHSLVYYKFSNKKELDGYLALLDDRNHNIGRAAAASLRDIKLNEALNNYLKSTLIKRLLNPHYDSVNKSELLTSYIKLFPCSFEYLKDNFGKNVYKDCLYNASAEFDTSVTALEFLLYNYPLETDKNKISILQSLISFQVKFPADGRLARVITGGIKSDFAPLIAIASDGTDSTLIQSNLKDLEEIIPVQIEKYKNNPDYQESITSLTELAKKIDTSFYHRVLEQLVKADYYAIKKFAYKLTGRSTISLVKDGKNFNKLWANSFKYKKALITTSKGRFTIEFLPGYAPITTGNFIYLTSRGFFKDNSFHRVVPGFVIQGGDPQETGWGGPGYDVPSEFSPLDYSAGMVGMASAGKDTEGSQWFVTTGNFPHLNGRYTIFAKVINGLNIVNLVEQNDKVISIRLFN